ncbi:MAG TPA: hypothetical protein VMD91_10745 [Candidatus Sulfotelmatobacter sp.]|nr:hypothetical protein [Candidatus Sulfotelmatobacter sp.]
MKRSFAPLALVAAAVLLGVAAAPGADAPLDQYFGPFKMSALEVRERIDKLGEAYAKRWADDASLLHDAGMVESSLQAWAARYPHDHWLAPTAFHLAQLYQEIQTPQARARARAMYAYVVRAFPSSRQAHLARERLAHGFPPLHAESAVRPTPYPYATAAPATPAASAAPSPAPGTATSAPASSEPATGTPAPAASGTPPPKPGS